MSESILCELEEKLRNPEGRQELAKSRKTEVISEEEMRDYLNMVAPLLIRFIESRREEVVGDSDQ